MTKNETVTVDAKAKNDRLERENHMRRLIKSAAFELMAEKGIDKVSMREIAERVKVTKPVLYYYFKNKEDLCASIIEEHRAEFDELLVGACKQGMSLQGLMELAFNAHLNFFEKDPRNSKFIIRMISYMLDGSHPEIRHAQRPDTRWEDFFMQAEKRGELPKKAHKDALRLVGAIFAQIMFSAYVKMNMEKSHKKCSEFFYDKDTTKRLTRIILLGINKYYEEEKK